MPSKWSRVGPAPGDHRINLSIGLKQGQFNELERHLYEGEESELPLLCLPIATVAMSHLGVAYETHSFQSAP